MVTTDGEASNGQPRLPDPGRISTRRDFAAELTRARRRAGKTVRTLALEVDQRPATIGGYMSGRHLPPLRQTALLPRILTCLGITDADEVERWMQALERVRQKPGPRSGALATPYRGLESFRVEDAEWFFGRETLVTAITARLAEAVQDPGGPSMVVVVGPSGSGKSSVLHAGIVPAVEDGALSQDLDWRCVSLTPGNDPVAALAEVLAADLQDEPSRAAARLRNGGLGWPGSDGGVLIVVDQFEELFTMCADEAERQVFISALLRMSSIRSDRLAPVVVVVGLRADFYGRAAREPDLIPVLEAHQVIVGPMTTEELKLAIIEPARRAGCEVDAELVDALIQEFAPHSAAQPGGHDPGALPLLSHALLETFQRSRRGKLTVSDYRATGGIGDAISQTAEKVFNELTPADQALARRVFLRLVNVNDDSAMTRRRVLRRDLPVPAVSDGSGEGNTAKGALDRVLHRFASCRFLTVHQEVVEVSHEALLTAWPRLSEWIKSDMAALPVRRELGEAARTWDKSARDPSALLRGARLDAVRTWASSDNHSDDLNDLERSFLDASAEYEHRDQQTARRRKRVLQTVSVIAAVFAVAATTFASAAVRTRNDAVHVRDLALSRQIAMQAIALRASDPSLAAQLALIAYRTAPTPEARSALVDASAVPMPLRLNGQPGATALAVSRDGTALAVGRAIDGALQLYSVSGTAPPAKEGVLKSATQGTAPFTAAFSPDGRTIAAGGTDDAVYIWDVSDRARPAVLAGPLKGLTGHVLSVAFSPDGLMLAAAGEGAGVLRWDVTAPASPVALPPLTPAAASTFAVAFSPDGESIAAGGVDGIVRLWSARGSERAPIAEVPNPAPTTVTAVAFSPDGRTLAAGDKRKTIRRWDVSNRGAPTEIGQPLTGFNSWVNSVTFSPDGRTLAAGSSDSTIRFWDAETWRARPTPLPNPAPVTAVSFFPDGSRLISVAGDGAARLWSLPLPVIEGPSDSIFGLVYSSDGRRLAVVPTRDGSIPIWDTSSPGRPHLLGRATLPEGIGVQAGSGAISPNGQILAAGTSKGGVQLFDVTNPMRPTPLGAPLVQSTALVEQVNFSRDGRLLAAGGDDNSVVLWDVTDPMNPSSLARLTGHTKQIVGLAFSPDGQLVATGSADKTTRLWNIADPLHPVAVSTLGGFDDYVWSVAFSSDSHMLAAGSADKTVRLWDVSDPSGPKPLGGPITGPNNSVNFVAFDPSGQSLVAAVSNGRVWQWDITIPARPRHLATLTGAPGDINVLTFSPDGASLAAAGSDKTVYLWQTGASQVARDLCLRVGDPITRNEWTQYIPDRPYAPPCH